VKVAIKCIISCVNIKAGYVGHIDSRRELKQVVATSKRPVTLHLTLT
jgi:hypothetical protein